MRGVSDDTTEITSHSQLLSLSSAAILARLGSYSSTDDAIFPSRIALDRFGCVFPALFPLSAPFFLSQPRTAGRGAGLT
jgi:hypothetical protein